MLNPFHIQRSDNLRIIVDDGFTCAALRFMAGVVDGTAVVQLEPWKKIRALEPEEPK